ncbi:diaminopropionate ammonia-lyase [Candidatus Chloroploca asiatica]|uniref:Pyridoxal-5'-phosphate-dependent protein subunit beta n=1 Tax=Candidatus Chloroploca asiatica TaxID=1506545 RepID=A0A2H3KNZ6_9CHLR|nr:diaminopropionate ammonia-lyase [Candidatus Chloroploca asiatica]PDV99916.1 pyridoxal-5'-phosphate-dependent protein subunit beta [Candidatus Chloroploca asiatica]
MYTIRAFHNQSVRETEPHPSIDRSPLAFHQRLPGYTPTPLIDVPALAHELGIARLWVKRETSRLAMPSFKILGASWAVYQALIAQLGTTPSWQSLEELAAAVAPLQPLTLAAATDGNHGRAVARMAALLGCRARIFVPAGTAEARITAIQAEGAEVLVVEGTYDDAIIRSAQEAGPHCLVISDTSWPGYEAIPRHVIEGYSTIGWEVDDELERRDEDPPDLVVVQMGVGALAAAITSHYRRPAYTMPPRIIGIEPTRAACILASMEAGTLTTIPGPHDSIMAGLNCGAPSLIAWPIISAGINLFLAIDDQYACTGVRLLAQAGILAGETGAAGLGGLLALRDNPRIAAAIGLRSTSRVLVLCTEGATDPDAHARILASDCRTDCLHRRACMPTP